MFAMTCLQQKSHVPKFGNWDGDNVPYTAYFENARKEKIGGVRMNPNDPEENPDAFLFSGIMNGISDTSINSSASSRKSNKDKATPSDKHFNGQQRNAYDQQKSVSLKSTTSTTSESSSDKSNPDKANHNRNLHQRKRSENKKSTPENIPNFFPLSPSPGHNRLRGGANGSDDHVSILLSCSLQGSWTCG